MDFTFSMHGYRKIVCVLPGKKVEDKSNGITAIPVVLKSLDITDSIVSIDAISTQIDIANQITGQKGHYFLSVKANQESLLEDIQCAFKVHQGYDRCQIMEKDHGRIETRTCSILSAGNFLLDEAMATWKNVATLVRIEATRRIKDITRHEVRYYISDESGQPASYYMALARGHWSIENHLHWHLDVSFMEDACRAREKNAPENLATLRKLALQIITNANDKLSIRKRQYKAAPDIQYMKSLIKL
jgi:predicted transposase YbfD/YdcC